MNPVYSRRAYAGIAMILFLAALAVCTLASYASLPDRNNSNSSSSVVMDEERFQGIRALLPLRGTVGYLGDFGGDPDNTRAWYRTQYFLAPVVVAQNQALDLVVANFAPGYPIARLAAAHGLAVEREFRNGTALLRRRSR